MNIKIALENNFKVTKKPLIKMALDHIEELEAQTEKMKCCQNCRKFNSLSYDCTCAKVCKEWELKEE